jgi:hypothetical protein
MCELYEYEQLPLLLIADLHGKEKALKAVYKIITDEMERGENHD